MMRTPREINEQQTMLLNAQCSWYVVMSLKAASLGENHWHQTVTSLLS